MKTEEVEVSSQQCGRGIQSGFFSDILAPGSSLHPTFLLILDIALALLLCVFLALLVITRGNVHIFVLVGIELCLWASVKWFVYELQKTEPRAQSPSEGEKDKQE